jgi:hypothetical protein
VLVKSCAVVLVKSCAVVLVKSCAVVLVIPACAPRVAGVFVWREREMNPQTPGEPGPRQVVWT